MVFPFLAMFQLAKRNFRLVYWYIKTNEILYSVEVLRTVWICTVQAFQWCMWWATIVLLWLSCVIGRILYPIYSNFLIHCDTTGVSSSRKTRKRIRKNDEFVLCMLSGTLVYLLKFIMCARKTIAFLSQTQYRSKTSISYKLIQYWNKCRHVMGSHPPHGWPLQCMMFLIAFGSMFATVSYGYKCILQKKAAINNVKEKQVFQSQHARNDAKLRSEVFDEDSDTIIVDNSANCIIWRHKKNVVPESYVAIKSDEACGVSSAVGNGQPKGVSDLNIGWKDDDGKFHSFVKPKVFHIPKSPVNILGVSAFLKAIGDFDRKGTRINSSGQDSIFSWNNGQFYKMFTHSLSDMPEMTVNDGYAAFHRFCNFIESMYPLNRQCYHTKSHQNKKSTCQLYDCREEIMYKNEDHLEKGIIEGIQIDNSSNKILYDVKFQDDRKVQALEDNILTSDESDLSILPNDTKEFINIAKCLTEDEVELIRNPPILSSIEKEWKALHDQCGHLPFGQTC